MKINICKVSILVLAFSTLIFLPAIAQGRSIFCEDKDNIIYKGISCCSTVIEQKICKKAIDELVSEDILEIIDKTKSEILRKKHTPGVYPNCHWFALYNINPESYASPYYQDGFTITEMTPNFSLIESKEDLIAGDLLYFEEHLQMRNDDYSTGSRRVRYTAVSPALSHSAIYIGEGLILQKENVTTEHFSIAPIQKTFDAYEKSLNSNRAYQKGHLKLYFYRY